MSTLKIKNIQHPSATDPAMVLYSDGTYSSVMDDVNAPSLHGGSFSLRNKLINGDFTQWQRGSNFSAVGYTADRWYTSSAAAITRVFGPSDFIYGYNISGTTTVSQLIELPIVGKCGEYAQGTTWALTWYSTIDLSTPAVNFRDGTGSNSNDVALTVGTPEVIGVDGVWTRYSAIVTVDADPAATNKGLAIHFNVPSAGSIAGVQFEKGGHTSFEHRHYGLELSLAQRYYERIKNGQASGFVNSATEIAGTVQFTTPKRNTTYSVNVFAPGDYISGGTNSSITTLSFTNGKGERQVGIESTSFTGSVVAGQGLLFRDFDIGVDAEL